MDFIIVNMWNYSRTKESNTEQDETYKIFN